MTANMQARRAYWADVAGNSEGYGDGNDPYVYC
jgi:hypothetical protein